MGNATLDRTLQLCGASGPQVSHVVPSGDVNGDGFDGLIIEADSADPNSSNSGARFVVFGGNFSGAVTTDRLSGGVVLTLSLT